MKITVDTNVLVRLVMADDEAQSVAATEAMENASVVAISVSSLCELAWVLARQYGMGRSEIAGAIRSFIETRNVVLNRPAVEAGERLGFLPGTLSEKIDPYLRPLYDALYDMMDPELIPKLMTAGVIEVAPLAYMRGRTLNSAFIVLDEAQNTTAEQMKMFLTRLGFGSKIVVTGDVTQVDLPGGVRSGLRMVEGILEGIEDVSFNRLTAHDVVRHKLVGKIVAAYDEYDARAEQLRSMRSGKTE